ncbi:hypothetical protein GCM10020370_08810 [Paenibacillus hodogayensis]
MADTALCSCLTWALPAGIPSWTAYADTGGPASVYRSIVIDAGDAGYSESGSWSTSTAVKGVNGSSSRYTSIGGSSIT